MIPKNLQALLASESTAQNSQELRQCLHIIEDILKAKDITIEYFERNNKPSLLAYKKGKRPERFSVLLNGHVDVVPAKPEQFQPFVKEGKLYGRGALDMKVAAYTLAEVFVEMVNTVEYPLGLQIVTDEEIGGKDGTKYQLEQGVDADFVLAGEFTNLDINIASKGICWVKATARGTAAHSAYLWNGENALHNLRYFVDELMKTYPVPDKEVWQTTVNLAKISTPHATTNRVPDAAEAIFDIRYTPEDKNFRSKQAAEAFLASLSSKVEVEVPFFESCHAVDKNNAYVRQLAHAVKQTTRKQPRLYKKNGASDIRYYSEKGRAAVTFGLAGEELHGDEEYVKVASIKQYKCILKDFLLAL